MLGEWMSRLLKNLIQNSYIYIFKPHQIAFHSRWGNFQFTSASPPKITPLLFIYGCWNEGRLGVCKSGMGELYMDGHPIWQQQVYMWTMSLPFCSCCGNFHFTYVSPLKIILLQSSRIAIHRNNGRIYIVLQWHLWGRNPNAPARGSRGTRPPPVRSWGSLAQVWDLMKQFQVPTYGIQGWRGGVWGGQAVGKVSKDPGQHTSICRPKVICQPRPNLAMQLDCGL